MDEATHKLNFKPIVIRDLFMDKSPKLARLIPGFVYRFLSRILRIDFINDPILYKHGYKKNVDFARASIDAFNVTLDVSGKKHLPAVRRFIFVSNHPLGGFDGIMIISELSRNYPHLKVLVNDLLTKAKQSKRDIIPIHVSGRCSNFFYNLANTRKFLGIKANLEMFFLPNESYKHRNKHFVITFGKPIPYQTFDKRFSPVQWAARVKDYTYSLVENPEGEFSDINN